MSAQRWIPPLKHAGIRAGRCDDKIMSAWRQGSNTAAIAAMFPTATEADVANRLGIIRDAAHSATPRPKTQGVAS